MANAMVTLEDLISRLAREGELYEHLPEGRVRCYACGHRCLIPPGHKGICKVRWNQDGRLMVPTGYVAALQLDPVEKKPFFHAYPGARALSFGMLGCDYHCAYCVAPDTLISTANGLRRIDRLFDLAEGPAEADRSSIRAMAGLEVYTHTGQARRVRALFRHPYSGPMVRLELAYLPALRLTPDHELLAVSDAEVQIGETTPRFIRADQLTARHYLAVPRHFEFSRPSVLDVAAVLRPLARRIRQTRKIGPRFLRRILRLSTRGLTSAEIGRRFGKHPSHIRHLRSKVQRRAWDLNELFAKRAEVRLKARRVRLSKEHGPGIPESLPLDERLAALVGYYAAEGCIVRNKNRVHSADLVFALGRHASLCGRGSRRKHLPAELFQAPRSVVEAFLRAYIAGDGHQSKRGMISVPTVSRRLAHEVAWLVLKTGRFPSIRRTRLPRQGLIIGRTVRSAPDLFTVYWFEDSSRRRRLHRDDRYFYVPIRRTRTRPYHGFVYNLEVEDDHSYLAPFVNTHNCQNYLTSQALRDPAAGVPPQEVTPRELVDLARRHGARILTSTYNEPLITSEWAIEVFKVAKARGLTCSYVSNGNATPEVLDYIRPWVDLYKVDLKGFDDKHYRKLGGVLQTVLDSIRRLHESGFWLEIVTLVIPGFNDSDGELRDIARFLVSVSPDIPWHVTAFHQDYKMTDRDNTSVATLLRAAGIGRAEGLRYVYAGNLPGRVGPFENTYCPSCGALLIERIGYRIVQDLLAPARGSCSRCSTVIPGVWGESVWGEEQHAH
jgi:pyruvate formate lyase activating enzyme